MAFKLLATHLPTGNVQEYGPWEANANPMVAAAHVSFAQGFVCGFNSCQYGPDNYKPQDLTFEVIEVPDEPQGANTVGQVEAYASASVTHADGTTD
jgi:hypothetical protein